MSIFKGNLERLTLDNNWYRKVLSTNSTQQLVLMALPPRTEIGTEVHPETSQFIRIEGGHGVAWVNTQKFLLKDGDALIIPPGSLHNIINTSPDSPLRLYTIYSPPHHPPGTVHKVKQD